MSILYESHPEIIIRDKDIDAWNFVHNGVNVDTTILPHQYNIGSLLGRDKPNVLQSLFARGPISRAYRGKI